MSKNYSAPSVLGSLVFKLFRKNYKGSLHEKIKIFFGTGKWLCSRKTFRSEATRRGAGASAPRARRPHKKVLLERILSENASKKCFQRKSCFKNLTFPVLKRFASTNIRNNPSSKVVCRKQLLKCISLMQT